MRFAPSAPRAADLRAAWGPSRPAQVRGLTRVTVRSEEEALAQYFVGEQGRSMAQHVLNASSSRSHCVFTLHLRIRTSDAANERAVVSRLHLVDLAGSERTKKTNASGQVRSGEAGAYSDVGGCRRAGEGRQAGAQADLGTPDAWWA